MSDAPLNRIGQVITQLADRDILPWLELNRDPSDAEAHRSATIVADRLCSALTNPILRNAQEQRQLLRAKEWLEQRGYVQVQIPGLLFSTLRPGTFAFRLNVKVRQDLGTRTVNIPVDIVIMPRSAKVEELPLLVEAKSAGDFTNTNKRRKEEAIKITQLRKTYGENVRFILLLCGYFDSGYLGYEAAEGIDWFWEHRMDDLERFGV